MAEHGVPNATACERLCGSLSSKRYTSLQRSAKQACERPRRVRDVHTHALKKRGKKETNLCHTREKPENKDEKEEEEEEEEEEEYSSF